MGILEGRTQGKAHREKMHFLLKEQRVVKVYSNIKHIQARRGESSQYRL